jgi:leucyl/phenylalanyl-tRNA---protein transferase
LAIYQLPDEIIFPDASLAEEDGLLAIGGDLTPERILTAYSHGIFPWFNEEEPILWWSPNPRCVSFPSRFKPSKSLRLLIQKNKFEIRYDFNFEAVITNCSQVARKEQTGTWITSQMIKAYTQLHKMGFAHSVETYLDGVLVGGLYGIAIGKAFYGESMFHKIADASKVAFSFLVEKLNQGHFEIIDNQMTTPHLLSLGAEEISRDQFLMLLQNAIQKETDPHLWK